MTDKKKIVLLALLLITFTLCGTSDVLAYGEGVPNVLKTLGKRTGTFARELRSFAFIISGFGIIMFTWAAIFGKINFRHLGYIMISLFFLSGVGLFISYMTGGDYRNNKAYMEAFEGLYKDSKAIQNAGKGEFTGGGGASTNL